MEKSNNKIIGIFIEGIYPFEIGISKYKTKPISAIHLSPSDQNAHFFKSSRAPIFPRVQMIIKAAEFDSNRLNFETDIKNKTVAINTKEKFAIA